MIEDSPDGYIAVGNYECEGEHKYQDMVLELKCPYPDESKVNVHYKIPVYYTTQLLCHMKAKEVGMHHIQSKALYCKVQPRHALLGYPFHNTAAHTEAMPTREGI